MNTHSLVRPHVIAQRGQKPGWVGTLPDSLVLWCLCVLLSAGCAHAPASTEGEPGVEHLPKVFGKLWKVYPNKTDREGAIEAWNRLKVTDEELKQMRIAYAQWKSSAEWTREKGAHVPPLSKWLTDRMWEQEAPPPAPPPPLHVAEASSFLVQPLYLAPRLAFAISGTLVGGVVWPFDQAAAAKVWDASLRGPWVWHQFIAGEPSDE